MVTLLWWLGTNAILVAGLAPVVWLLCRLLRSRPAAQHLLWFLLFLKLIAPQVLYWPWPVDQMIVVVTSPRQPVTQIESDVPFVSLDQESSSLAPDVLQAEPSTEPWTAQNAVTTEGSEPAFSIVAVALGSWAAGAGLLLLFAIAALWRQRQIVRNSIDPPDHLSRAIGRVARRLGIRPPKTAVSEQIATPVVCCVGSPRLLWPATMSDLEVVAQCHGVVAHELAHLARRDHYFVYAELIVTVCCWWNPLMWVIRRRVRETRELACDAKAIAAVQEPRCHYAQRLLSLSVSHREGLAIAPGFGTGLLSRRFLKRRLTMVFDERVDGRISVGGIVLALMLIAVGLPGFSLAQPPTDAPAVNQPDAGSTAEASQSSSGSSTSETVIESSGGDEPRRTILRTRRLSKLVTNDAISGDKSVTIDLGNGGTIRISKNDKGDLLLTFEQTEGRDILRTGRAVRDPNTGLFERDTDARTGGAASAGAAGSGQSLRTSADFFARHPQRRIAESNTRGRGADSDFDRELLRSDVELAEVNLMEKRAELEIAAKDNVDAGRRKLAELAVRRAEIELNRAKLRLTRGDLSNSDRPTDGGN